MRCKPSGPTSATIAIVGEAPGAEEEREGLPFVGSSGYELDRMLKDAGLNRESIFITNVTHERPPNNEISHWISEKKKAPDSSFIYYRGRWCKPFIRDECLRLEQEMRAVQPNVVIALGNTPMWALLSTSGVGKWRGSCLSSDTIPNLKVIPTYHPAFVLRSYGERAITVQDLRRAKRESYSPLWTSKPSYNFITKPTFQESKGILEGLIARLERGPFYFTLDLEIYRREILCVGIGTSKTDAICLPFLYTKGYYWSPEEYIELTSLLTTLLTHPNARPINQNISFDIQYLFWRFFIRPRPFFDTMVAHNLLFSGLPKRLDYIASMVCDHYVYWKDDGKFWEKFDDEELWHYNCLDCTYTYECWEKQHDLLIAEGLTEQMSFQMTTLNNLLTMMFTGVKVDHGNKVALLGEVQALIKQLHQEVTLLVREDLTGEKGDFSNKKLAHLFYTTLGLPPIYKQVKKDGKRVSTITCDDDALKKIATKNLWLRPLIDRINMIRSYGTAEDICKKKTDHDHRWRTSYGVGVTTTYRLNSSENPLDSGLNLQNLTTGRDILKYD